MEKNSIEWVFRNEREYLWGVGADYWDWDVNWVREIKIGWFE